MEFLKNLKFTWKFARKQKKNLIAYTIFSIISIVISVFVPILSAKIIVSLTNNEFKQLILIAILIFIVENIRNLVHCFQRHNSNILFRETYINLQTELGKEILKLENRVIDNNGAGVFIQRLTNDTSKLSDIFPMLINYLTNIITNIGIFGAIFILNKAVFIYLIVAISIMYLIEKKRVKLRIKMIKNYMNQN